MAFANVNCMTAIWQSWGLKYIFRPADASGTNGSRKNAPQEMSGVKAPRVPVKPWPMRDQATSSGCREPDNRRLAPLHKDSQQPAQSVRLAKFRPIPPEQWPPIWREQLGQTKPGVIAWTYWHLGADLLGDKHPQFNQEEQARRRRIMGRLLGALGHPAGTHTFWPTQLDLAENPQAQPDIFWSGLRELGCRGLLIFGSQAAWPLLNTRSVHPFQSERRNGIFIYVLNDMGKLADDQEQFGQTVAYLRSSLGIFVR